MVASWLVYLSRIKWSGFKVWLETLCCVLGQDTLTLSTKEYKWVLANCWGNLTNYEGILQPWPELLGHKGNKPIKMTYFLPPPPPDAMLMSGIQVIFGRLNIAWGKGGQKKWFTKTTLPTFFKRWIQSLI